MDKKKKKKKKKTKKRFLLYKASGYNFEVKIGVSRVLNLAYIETSSFNETKIVEPSV